MLNQIEKNKQRCAAMLANMKSAKDPDQKRAFKEKLNFWKNQVRMAEAAEQSKNKFKPLFN